MSESGAAGGAGVGRGAAASSDTVSGDGRRHADSGIDERSQRLLQGGAASRAWADTAARETVRTEPVGAHAASAYAVNATPSAGPAQAGAASSATAAGSGRIAQPRRARLRVSHVNPMSVLRLSLLFGACMLIVLLVAVAALWFVLNSAGVFSSINTTAAQFADNGSGGGVAGWLSFGRVMLVTAVLGVVNVIAFALLATVGSLLYNLCSDFVGGVEVTLSER